MLPTLVPGEVVFAVKKRRYHNEDIVVLRHRGTEKIKRVRAVQGNYYDVRGDNSLQSTDSRQFGLIDRSAVLGKVVWPRG